MVNSVATSNLALPIKNGLKPPEGPKALGVTFNVINGLSSSCNIDLVTAGISFVQTVFIDNSENSQSVDLSIIGTGQIITAQGNTQGFYPLLSASGQINVSIASSGNAKIICQFLNVEIQPFVYNSEPPEVVVSGSVTVSSGSIAATQAGTWNVNVTDFPAQPQSVTVASGNIAASQYGAWSVAVNNFPATQAVTQSGIWSIGVNNFPATQAVTQSGAWSVAVNNFPATQAVTQSGTWSIGINNFPSTQAVTQSGTWTVSSPGIGNSLLGQSASVVVKSSAGNLRGFSVLTAGTTAGSLYDSATVGAISASVLLAVVPASVQYVDTNGITFKNGLVYVPGTSQVASLFFS